MGGDRPYDTGFSEQSRGINDKRRRRRSKNRRRRKNKRMQKAAINVGDRGGSGRNTRDRERDRYKKKSNENLDDDDDSMNMESNSKNFTNLRTTNKTTVQNGSLSSTKNIEIQKQLDLNETLTVAQDQQESSTQLTQSINNNNNDQQEVRDPLINQQQPIKVINKLQISQNGNARSPFGVEDLRRRIIQIANSNNNSHNQNVLKKQIDLRTGQVSTIKKSTCKSDFSNRLNALAGMGARNNLDRFPVNQTLRMDQIPPQKSSEKNRSGNSGVKKLEIVRPCNNSTTNMDQTLDKLDIQKNIRQRHESKEAGELSPQKDDKSKEFKNSYDASQKEKRFLQINEKKGVQIASKGVISFKIKNSQIIDQKGISNQIRKQECVKQLSKNGNPLHQDNQISINQMTEKEKLEKDVQNRIQGKLKTLDTMRDKREIKNMTGIEKVLKSRDSVELCREFKKDLDQHKSKEMKGTVPEIEIIKIDLIRKVKIKKEKEIITEIEIVILGILQILNQVATQNAILQQSFIPCAFPQQFGQSFKVSNINQQRRGKSKSKSHSPQSKQAQTPASSDSSQAYSQLCQLINQSKDAVNYEEAIRKFENTEDALKEKKILRTASMKGAKIDVRLFIGQTPRTWDDNKVMLYFKRFGSILEAKIIRDKGDNSHKGCAFIRCMNFHEAEYILKVHKVSRKMKQKRSRSRSQQKQMRGPQKDFRFKGGAGNKRNAINKGKAIKTEDIKRQNSNKSARSNSSLSDDNSSINESKDEDSSDEHQKYFNEDSGAILSKLQVRYADGELERLGIVNLEKVEQSKLYVCHINKFKQVSDVNKLFTTFGDIEELYLFKDSEEKFKGSCFIKYQTRKQAVKAIARLNQKGNSDGGLLKQFPDFVEEGGLLDIRFADKKRKDNIPLSLIPQSLLQANLNENSFGLNQQQQMMNFMIGNQPPKNSNPSFMSQNVFFPQSQNQAQAASQFINPLAYPGQFGALGMQQQFMNPASMLSLSGGAAQNPMALSMGFIQMIPQKPGVRVFLETFNHEGKLYYYDVQKQVSTWDKPKRSSSDTEEVKIYSSTEVQELYQNYMTLVMSYGMPMASPFLNPIMPTTTGLSIPGMLDPLNMKPFNMYPSASNNTGDIMAQSQQSLSQNDHSQAGSLTNTNQGVGNQQNLSEMNHEEQMQHQAIHGQYKQGPPGANLFIFHLPNEWGDLDLYLFFDSFKLGNIVSVRIMTDKENGRSKGFGFVSYDNPHGATQAIKIINGKSALGKRLKVEMKKGGIHFPQHDMNGHFPSQQNSKPNFPNKHQNHQQKQYPHSRPPPFKSNSNNFHSQHQNNNQYSAQLQQQPQRVQKNASNTNLINNVSGVANQIKSQSQTDPLQENLNNIFFEAMDIPHMDNAFCQ